MVRDLRLRPDSPTCLISEMQAILTCMSFYSGLTKLSRCQHIMDCLSSGMLARWIYPRQLAPISSVQPLLSL